MKNWVYIAKVFWSKSEFDISSAEIVNPTRNQIPMGFFLIHRLPEVERYRCPKENDSYSSLILAIWGMTLGVYWSSCKTPLTLG
ncbi:hypothetical protein MKW98_008144, partial [Papaver atlanticum]